VTEIDKLYLNYLDMTEHLPGPRMPLEEYKKERAALLGVFAEVDAEQILKDEAKRIEKED
jgi:hypothetical protein